MSLLRRRQLVRALACLPALSALAACRSETDKASARAPSTTLTVLIWAPDWPAQMQQVAEAFERDNPDIAVNVQFMIGNSVEENIKPKLVANKLPDLMSVNPNPYAAALADQGILAEVGATKAWANLLPGLKGDWTSRAGKHFGIAGGVAATLMYYNKSMFAKAGVASLPQDFDQFLALCAQIKQAGMTPIVWNGGFPNNLGNGPFSYGFANNIVAHEPDWKAKIGDGSLRLDTPAGADIFAKIRLVAERGFVQKGFMDTGYDEGMRLFTEGKVAMAFQGTWAAGHLLNGKDFQTGMFMPPWNAPGETVVPVIGSETGFAVCETRNKAAATRLLEFIMGKGYPIQQHQRHNVPPLINVDGAVVSSAGLQTFLAKASAMPLTASPYYSFLPANTIAMLHPLIQDVLMARITPRQAAARLDASIRNEAKNNYK